MSSLPTEYERVFDEMLSEVASGLSNPNVPLVPFWPLRGARFDGDLMVIGRSVNGWVEDWTALELRDREMRAGAVATMRSDAESGGRDRMAWVRELWGNTAGYNTKRSAFWRAVRNIVDPRGETDDWASRIVWTNLYKVSPAAGWNPGADLRRAQRPNAVALLRMELDTFAPGRVLAFTGGWIQPFIAPLGIELNQLTTLVEGVGADHARSWVVAKHPMGKPGEQMAREIRAAFATSVPPIL